MLGFFIKLYRNLRYTGMLLVLLFVSWTTKGGTGEPDSRILIISSYNPETSQTAKNISDFIEEYGLLGGKFSIDIENMNCKSFSEACMWEGRMKELLDKNIEKGLPKLIILLGQEAWTAYWSQDSLVTRDVPIMGGMVSRNAVLLPEEGTDLENWEAESVDVMSDNIRELEVFGFAYEYDVVANLRLILDFYPETKHIAFITDNSYGGVSLQALVKKEMKEKFPGLDLILLHGRKHTIYSISDAIARLPEKTVILLGTWRVDKNDGYFMRNATYSMMMANPKIPAFTITSIGMGHWAVGGCVPRYRTVGKDMAKQALALERQHDSTELAGMQIIPNEYCFDYTKLCSEGFLNKAEVKNAVLYNKNLS